MSDTKKLPVQPPVAIIGMGKSGDSALNLLMDLGIARDQILSFDQKPLAAQTSSPDQVKAFGPRTLVVSPGVPLATPWIQELLKSGAHLTSELTLACQLLTTEKIIGITGSVGKSTTTAALGAATQAIDPHVFTGGNLGTPLSSYAHEIFNKKRPRANYIILELSSFHLENCTDLKLHHSIITFLSANHLERYSGIDQYYQTKFKVAELTQNKVILNSKGGDLPQVYKNYLSDLCSVVWSDPKSLPSQSIDLKKASLIGIHNQDNLALAYQVIALEKWGDKSIEALLAFTGLDHRLQKVGEFKNVLFINDSKATALDSVLIAVNSCLQLKRPGKLHILLGGRDKKLPWQDLHHLKTHPQLKFYFFGEGRLTAQSLSQLEGNSFAKLGEAIDSILSQVAANDLVLLSPGGTSMDEFKNFEERGSFFVQRVTQFRNS